MLAINGLRTISGWGKHLPEDKATAFIVALSGHGADALTRIPSFPRFAGILSSRKDASRRDPPGRGRPCSIGSHGGALATVFERRNRSPRSSPRPCPGDPELPVQPASHPNHFALRWYDLLALSPSAICKPLHRAKRPHRSPHRWLDCRGGLTAPRGAFPLINSLAMPLAGLFPGFHPPLGGESAADFANHSRTLRFGRLFLEEGIP